MLGSRLIANCMWAVQTDVTKLYLYILISLFHCLILGLSSYFIDYSSIFFLSLFCYCLLWFSFYFDAPKRHCHLKPWRKCQSVKISISLSPKSVFTMSSWHSISGERKPSTTLFSTSCHNCQVWDYNA